MMVQQNLMKVRHLQQEIVQTKMVPKEVNVSMIICDSVSLGRYFFNAFCSSAHKKVEHHLVMFTPLGIEITPQKVTEMLQ